MTMSSDHPSRMGHPRESSTAPSTAPIYQTTAFDVGDLDVLQGIHAGTIQGDIYTRDSNPNHSALAESIASLEGVEAGAVFASGMGALGSIFLTLASAGDHVILASALYGKTIQLANRMQKQFGITISTFDATKSESLREAISDKTRFVLIETVSNPLLEVADIQAIASILPPDIPLVVDSTFTSPMLIRPCQLGASIVMHSGSKYINGHGDVMLGLAAGSKEWMKRLNGTASVFGTNANPFESWLCQRGLKTLPLRMAHICRTTNELAQALSGHPGLRRVYHPSLPDHSSHEIAQRLYPSGTGGILTLELAGNGRGVVNAFMRAASSIPFSPTLADARTTLSHPATTSHSFMSSQARAAIGIRDELVRISVGLEPVEMLIKELTMALDQVAEIGIRRECGGSA
ncbi:MAG TPA: aminotransferase class I/II-fold pyridoxal phosphate-dependent enzyme [Planctomycetaceae bacterium]|nr:aminotransferase class I/II-fold pyridoxal phosphate-dependent enzyme [Planctomycetaceae bacterium]